jgi:hypothetical protein
MPDLLLRSYVKDYGSVDPVVVYETAEHFLESLRRTSGHGQHPTQRYFGPCIPIRRLLG